MQPLILVIEDNEQNAYLMRFLLERHGFEIKVAPTGGEGIEYAQRHRPSLVLLDIQLPVMDGYAVLRALRRLPDMAGVPIVAVTAHAMPGDREKILDAGCQGYVEKPVNPETFMQELKDYLPEPPPANDVDG